MRKRRAFFTRRGPAPKETVTWGLRGYVPRDLWGAFCRVGLYEPADLWNND